MSASEEMTFHIIYTPETVRALLPFVDSLLEWSDLSFRLIANGCGPEESALLQARCAGERRLAFIDLKSRQMLEHGAVLDRLFAADDGPFFCFMDSDIVATGDFMSTIRPRLDEADAVFSAWPITVRADERVRPTDSIHTSSRRAWTADGRCLGGTYLAIYRREPLRHALAVEPLGFRRAFAGLLPRATCDFLRAVDEDRLFHDTARALHFRLIDHGRVLRVQDTGDLFHIGNVSVTGSRERPKRSWRHIPGRAVRFTWRHVTGEATRQRILVRIGEDPTQRRVTDRAWSMSRYFGSLAAALATGGEPPPVLQLGDPEIDPQIVRGTELLVTRFR